MKTILEVSLQEASKAKDAIRYSLLRTELFSSFGIAEEEYSFTDKETEE